MDGFFRILEKTSSELICTRTYQNASNIPNPFLPKGTIILGHGCVKSTVIERRDLEGSISWAEWHFPPPVTLSVFDL
jgi:hypothetical protein